MATPLHSRPRTPVVDDQLPRRARLGRRTSCTRVRDRRWWRTSSRPRRRSSPVTALRGGGRAHPRRCLAMPAAGQGSEPRLLLDGVARDGGDAGSPEPSAGGAAGSPERRHRPEREERRRLDARREALATGRCHGWGRKKERTNRREGTRDPRAIESSYNAAGAGVSASGHESFPSPRETTRPPSSGVGGVRFAKKYITETGRRDALYVP